MVGMPGIPETEFGGEFATEAEYRDEFVAELIREKGWMLWPPVRYSYRTINYELPSGSFLSTSENWFGTDDQGRDVVARLIYGFRISVLFGLVLTFFSSIIGIIAGAVQGYYGGKTDLFFQRFMEIWSGMPQLYLLIILASFVEPNFWWLLLIMLLFSWMALVGVVRAEFLRGRNLEYVRAARALGMNNRQVMFRHILPNALVATMTFLPLSFQDRLLPLLPWTFLVSGCLRVLLFGRVAGSGKGQSACTLAGYHRLYRLALQLSLLVFIGEGVRDAFDPRHNR